MTPLQQEYLNLYATGLTAVETREKLNISISTLDQWLSTKEFRDAFELVRNRVHPQKKVGE